jgi:hypothetical protein
MALGRVDDFKAKLAGGGARGNLFQVNFSQPDGFNVGLDTELASFMCEAAVLPASTLGTIIVPFRGRQLKMAGDRQFGEWTVQVINDRDFITRNAMERWMASMANHSSAGGSQRLDEYCVNLDVVQFDRDEREIKRYFFKDAWPVAISEIGLNYGDIDSIERFTITWQYQYWTSNTTDGNLGTATPTDLRASSAGA